MALSEFDAVLGCHLGQSPYSGNAPVCGPYSYLLSTSAVGS